ncbi:MAG: hypothetical protein U1E19_10425 [Rhodoblastus sp.]|mgnify:CR=1 FL=1
MRYLSRALMFAAIAASCSATSLAAEELDWVGGNGRSCDAVCKQAGKQAVVAGYYKGGANPFYVCHADQAGEGWRAGYNLKPSWSNACMVPYGGKEVRASNYACACQ